MNVKRKKLKDSPDFGTPGSTFELCKGCLQKIVVKAGKVLSAD